MTVFRLSLALAFLATLGVSPNAHAQRQANRRLGITTASPTTEVHSIVFRPRANDEDASAAPYVIVGALVGGGLAALWEARAISQNGDDNIGAAGLLWIPPVAGAIIGAFVGWVIFKGVHSPPAT